MATGRTRRVRTVVGAAGLLAVPALLATVAVLPVVWLLEVPIGVGLLLATFIGPSASAAFGPVLVGRRIRRLPTAELDDRSMASIERRIAELAAEVGVDSPDLTVVRADAANVAVSGGLRGSRLVVSTRLLSLPAADREPALRHALIRLKRREATFTTAVLPGLLVVETVALAATVLVGRRTDRRPADRRVNRIHGYEPDPKRIPGPAYAVAGLCLWIAVFPAWLPAVVGDRLFIAGQRRAADAAVSRVGETEREGLANAVAFAGDAAGAADWPALLDRLSLVSMADDETGRVRGSSRQEARIRLARLRSKTSV